MSDESTSVTLVVFRRWRDRDIRRWRNTGDIIALFPELPSDYQGIYCDAYEHVGQHGGADYYGVIQATKPVSIEDAAPLAAARSKTVTIKAAIHPKSRCGLHSRPLDTRSRSDDNF